VSEEIKSTKSLAALQAEIVKCQACPRLRKWCAQVATDKVARFSHDVYWGKPVPSFGDAKAMILLVGLAPAAHGANRTGRVFTGDRSADFLYAAMHRAGLSNQATSTHKDDGLVLTNTYISMINHCAPPENKLTPTERDACLPFLVRELPMLASLRVLVAFGAFAWDGALRALSSLGHSVKPAPKFGHGAEAKVGPYTFLGCFHPSQQNTFTGRLTPPMIDAVLQRAKTLTT
jgi:uracil-DNA glycosylase